MRSILDKNPIDILEHTLDVVEEQAWNHRVEPLKTFVDETSVELRISAKPFVAALATVADDGCSLRWARLIAYDEGALVSRHLLIGTPVHKMMTDALREAHGVEPHDFGTD